MIIRASTLLAVSCLACAPALRTPAEIVALARGPDVGDLDRLFNALRSPIATMRSHAAWALGSRALDDPKPPQPVMTRHIVRAFDAEWKRPGGPDAAALGPIIRAIGNAGEAEDGERVAAYLRVLSPSLQGAVARMALGLALRKTKWGPNLTDAVAKIAALSTHPHRKLALVAAGRAKQPLAAATLADAFTSDDAEVRAVAVKVATFSPEIAAEKIDLVLKNDTDWRVQVEAARSLVLRGEAMRVIIFAAALWRQIRQNKADLDGVKAVVVLAALETLFAMNPLTPERRAAVRAIYNTATPALAGESLSVAWVHCRAAMIVEVETGLSDLTRNCGGDSIAPWRRADLVAELVKRLPREGAANPDHLKPFLASPDARVRAAILPAVVRLPAETARTIFLYALASADPVIAAVAADTIAQQPPKYYIRPDLGMAVMAAARRHAKTGDVEATITLAKVLGQYHRGIVDDVLIELTSHAEPSVALAAVAALSVHGITASPKFTRPASWSQPVAAPSRTARIHTSKGNIELQLHADTAPRTVANFAVLARKGFFNGLSFHRVVPDFVIQGGDPRGDGWGGPGHTIPCEPSLSERGYVRGSVGMALAGRHTGGSQFFITQSAQPHLDGRYTNFATVTAGMDVVDRIVVGDNIVRITVD